MRLPASRLTVCVCLAVLAGGAARGDVWWHEEDYPMPDRESVPEWLIGQKINFSRWDGGPLETCKGMLSGWPYYNAPWPDVIDAVTRWYDVETVDLAERMGYNFLWLTFSVGYSNEQEQYQWDTLRPYIEECHRRGIRVAAYMSSCNMFVDDMFVTVPESREWLWLDDDGEPVPYGAAAYDRMGRTTRMMADITHPGWKEYLKRRIDAAIDLGFDAIEYDNTHWSVRGTRARELYATFLEKNGFKDSPETRYAFEFEVMKRLFPELLAHARKRKPDMVMFININRPLYGIARGTTVIATEDGVEPGYYDFSYTHEVGAQDTLEPVHKDEFVDISAEPFNPDMMISNLGKLRVLHGLNDDWKPVLVEFGGRRNGHRLLNHYPPLAFQLAIAECNAALCSLQGYQEGLAQRDLYQRRPEVMKIVDAAGDAHRFVSEHEKYAVGARYRSDIAIVVDNRLSILRGWLPQETCVTDFAKANMQFDVVYEDRVTEEVLRKYSCVVVYDAKLIDDDALDALVAYARDCGPLISYGETGAMDSWGQPRHDNPLASAGPWTLAETEQELLDFAKANATPEFEVLNSPYALFTLTEGGATPEGGFVVHLLNYQKEALDGVRVRAPEGSNVSLLALTPGCNTIHRGEVPGEWVIPRLGVYSLLVVER